MHHSLKTISYQAIISKIARTYKPPDSSWITNAIEDIGWGIQAIGYHAGFEKKATEPPYILVNHHRGKIPCEVERIIHVEQLRIYRTDENILNPDGTTPAPSTSEDCSPNYKGVKMILSSDTTLASFSETSPKTTQMDTTMLENTFSINGDYVVTGFERGLIKLYYIAFVTDKDGMPCVIDDYDYKTALEWYCLEQMMHRGFKPSSGIQYREVHQLFEIHRLRAENAVKVMSLDGAERFGASFNRFVSNPEFSRNFYAGMEQQEYISL